MVEISYFSNLKVKKHLLDNVRSVKFIEVDSHFDKKNGS